MWGSYVVEEVEVMQQQGAYTGHHGEVCSLCWCWKLKETGMLPLCWLDGLPLIAMYVCCCAFILLTEIPCCCKCNTQKNNNQWPFYFFESLYFLGLFSRHIECGVHH